MVCYLFKVYPNMKMLKISSNLEGGVPLDITLLEECQRPMNLECLSWDQIKEIDNTQFLSTLIGKCSSTLKRLRYRDKNLGALQTITGW